MKNPAKKPKPDHNNPANYHGHCPECGASVLRTKRGTYALHTRMKYSSMGHAARRVRCHGGARPMPESAVDAWLQRRAEDARADHARNDKAATDARARVAELIASAEAAEVIAAKAITLAGAFEAEIANRASKGGA